MSTPESPAIPLLRTLISQQSTTLTEEPTTTFLTSHLTSLGWSIHLQLIPNSNPPRHNLYAYRPGPDISPNEIRKKVKVLLNSHVDTVPPHFDLREDEQNLYGRGSCDAKASIASQITAITNLLSRNILEPKHVGLLYVVGEETDHIGMKVANDLNLEIDYLVVGEPTECRIAKGHKGMIKADIVVEGKAGHSGYPECGVSAIEALVDILGELKNEKWPIDDYLGPTTLNFGTITGGLAANIIPPTAKATISFRLSIPAQETRTKLERIVLKPRSDGTTIRLFISGSMDPVVCLPLDIPGLDTFVAAYFTDIPYLNPGGNHQSVLYGPGSILVAHSRGEFVGKEEVRKAVEGYERIIMGLIGR